MARTNRQAIRIFTNGKRANDQYALAHHVGDIVKRTSSAQRKAAVSVARKVPVTAKQAITPVFNIKPGQLTDKFQTRVTPNALRIDASVRRFPLMAFGGKWGGRRSPGATAEIVRGERKTYTGAFINSVQGLKSIRERVATGGGRRVARGPLHILRGPSPAEMLADAHGEGVRDTVIRVLVDYYVAELRRLIAIEGAR